MKNNIILIGFMGCGKTSVGTALSRMLHIKMTDTDKEIELKSGLTVSEIFERFGEEAFRQMETDCLKSLLEEEEDGILSTGGGLPLREENRKLLKQLGTVVYLKVSAETVCGRLKGDKTRPLLQGGDAARKVEELLRKRSPVYEGAADWVIDGNDKSPNEIVKEITEAIRKP